MPRPLPPCDLREATDQAGWYYCRHTQVVAADDLVPAAACRPCQLRTVPCANPRPREREANRVVLPSLAQQAWNVVKAVGVFVADGMRTVSRKGYESRLTICETCAERVGDRCAQCGCHLSIKAQGRAFDCPLQKWPRIERGHD